MYLPDYHKNILEDLNIMLRHCSHALETIENSKEYLDTLHPFHASAVANYNRLTSITLHLDGMGAEEG